MTFIRMTSVARAPKTILALGAGLLTVATGAGVVGTASAADVWAANNAYCYENVDLNPSREFIREINYTRATKTMAFVVEHQTWSDSLKAYVRGGGVARSIDPSELGGEGVLAAFNDGGDASTACKILLGRGISWKGSLTKDK